MTQHSIDELKQLYKEKKLKEMAIRLPHVRHLENSFIKFLLESNLLRMRQWLNSPPITLGADPEFILYKKGSKKDIVLFSSKYTEDYFGISEAELGADYGLLEFRPGPETTAKKLVDNIIQLHAIFKRNFGPDSIKVLEKEAVLFDHKKKRVLQAMEEEEDINYGMNRGKDVAVWSGDGDDIMGDIETGVTLCAYDKPVFNQFNDKLFTAGGHIHIGGALIKMLSFNQLKAFVRKLDKEILPICNSVETRAGKLRRTVYGSPGEFRTKGYGIEYRSPSNAIFFQKNSKMLLKVLRKIKKILSTMGEEVI